MDRRTILIILFPIIIIGFASFRNVEGFLTTLFSSFQVPVISQEKVKIISEESIVIDVVKQSEPSVVTIAIKKSINKSSTIDSFFFFDFPSKSKETEDEFENIGSGFIVDKDGLIVTNKHVVSSSDSQYQVLVSSGKKYEVKQIYRDPLNDIAVLKIDPNENKNPQLKSVQLGDSSKIQVGQLVIAIGTALGEFNNTVTTGVVSGIGRGIMASDQFDQTVEELSGVIQTDAAINPGNSGGPLFNSVGQVIGVNTAVSQNGQNIGFALPINMIKSSLDNFNKTGRFERAYLGVGYKLIDQNVAIANDLPAGAYIQTVVDGSAADKAGIRVGDVITQVDKKKLVEKKYEISTIVSKKKIGDKLMLTVYREDENGRPSTKNIEVTLLASPQQ